MPQRRLALCGYQPSPAEKAAFLAGGLPFSVPGAPPARPARAEKRARQPKHAPGHLGQTAAEKARQPARARPGFLSAPGAKLARPNPMFSCVNTPKPGVFCARTPKGQGRFSCLGARGAGHTLLQHAARLPHKKGEGLCAQGCVWCLRCFWPSSARWCAA